jgi:hypothetical protein
VVMVLIAPPWLLDRTSICAWQSHAASGKNAYPA